MTLSGMKNLIKMKNKYTFSVHESFPCKSLWLKKGYDFVVGGGDFNSPEAVTGFIGNKFAHSSSSSSSKSK